MSHFETTATIASFGGKLLKLSHDSKTIGSKMSLNLYLPPATTSSSPSKTPVIFYLAGLTCTGDNGAEKGGFHAAASRLGIAIVYPDTSPRGTSYPGQDDSYDFGSGAGFYLNATEEPWSQSYKMDSYITQELRTILFDAFTQLDKDRVSIMGHSMGGHGALTLYLKNAELYKSVSAFAPIINPMECDWGKKAFKGYFGEDNKESWKKHDATELLKGFEGSFETLIDVGTADNFYKQGQLLPENFVKVAEEKKDKGMKVNLRMQDGYDHSYYTISTFAEDHLEYHAKHLSKS